MIAGDNLFDFSLGDFAAFWRAKGVASALAVYDCGDLELATHYGVVEVDDDDRVVDFEEKPAEPRSDARRDGDVPLPPRARAARRALPRRGQPARPAGTVRRLAVPRASRSTATRFDGAWFDIGNPEQLLEADNRWRRARRAPAARTTYSTLSSTSAVRAVALSAQSRHRHVRPRGLPCRHVLLDLLLPRRCVVCGLPGATVCARCTARCRGSRRRSAPAAARPSPGRSSAAASAPAAGSRSPPRGRRSSTTRRSARSSPPGRSAGCAGLAALAAAVRRRGRAAAARTTDHVRPARRRPEPEARPPPAGAPRPRARRSAGSCPSSRSSGGRGPSAPSAACLETSGGGTSAAPFAPASARGRVLLVDDVYTTGATVAAAASALRAAGASRVDVVTFARAVRG